MWPCQKLTNPLSCDRFPSIIAMTVGKQTNHQLEKPPMKKVRGGDPPTKRCPTKNIENTRTCLPTRNSRKNQTSKNGGALPKEFSDVGRTKKRREKILMTKTSGGGRLNGFSEEDPKTNRWRRRMIRTGGGVPRKEFSGRNVKRKNCGGPRNRCPGKLQGLGHEEKALYKTVLTTEMLARSGSPVNLKILFLLPLTKQKLKICNVLFLWEVLRYFFRKLV